MRPGNCPESIAFKPPQLYLKMVFNSHKSISNKLFAVYVDDLAIPGTCFLMTQGKRADLPQCLQREVLCAQRVDAPAAHPFYQASAGLGEWDGTPTDDVRLVRAVLLSRLDCGVAANGSNCGNISLRKLSWDVKGIVQRDFRRKLRGEENGHLVSHRKVNFDFLELPSRREGLCVCNC
ncbi:hypothetical protein CEXT_602431 [Caerostris extrusa]|uniref:Reverse transcriptase n=1 Tax=Caerostris extrusa TaxID=172846 RepID=A0AAV4XFG4_CAEEX|nr:hypothetical protein CEXT_602431 [Caerostris extrusa]